MDNGIVKIVDIDVNEIIPNRFQPRRQFDEEEILDLSDSIRKYGIIQPLVVRPTGDKYEIIAGERRYKAAILAGLEHVPVIIKNLTDKDSAELAIIENIQRRNLSAIEEALSYKKILDMGYLTQEDLAYKLGKSQPTVANKIRLLNLSDEVQEALLENKISERHARSLLRIPTQSKQNEMLNRIISERLTVRKTDEEINRMKEVESGEKEMNEGNGVDISTMENMTTPQTNDAAINFNTGGAPEFTIPQVPAQPEAPQPAEVTPMLNITQDAPATPEFTMPQVPAQPEAPQPAEVTPMLNITQDTPATPEFTMPQVPAQPEAPQPVEVTPMLNITQDTPATPEFTMPQIPETEPIIEQPEVSQPMEATQLLNIPEDNSIDEAPEFEMPQETEPENSQETIPEPMEQQPIIITDYNKQYDPVMPQTEPQPNQKADFKQVIDAIRECNAKIEQYGYIIDVEEYDLANLYQVVFKVEK